MKYFMSMYSPSREGRRVFLMTRVSAEYYYRDYLQKFSDVHKARCFEEGSEIRSPNNDSLFIWGENISDKEIFKRRLMGSVDKLTLEVIGH